MRLPNLVEHDTLHEVIYNLQMAMTSSSSSSLFKNHHHPGYSMIISRSRFPNRACHGSLSSTSNAIPTPSSSYAPCFHRYIAMMVMMTMMIMMIMSMTIIWIMTQVCLERPIYPCRSLCLGVRQGCQGRMEAYGFPWSVLWIGHWTVSGTFIHPWSAYGTCMLLGTWSGTFW